MAALARSATCVRLISSDFALKLSAVTVKRCSSLSALTGASETVQYPQVKPRFPPGEWGDMTEKQAWQWHELGEEIRQLPTAQEKIDRMTSKAFLTWDFHPVIKRPRMLGYQAHQIKTHVALGYLPLHYQYMSVEEEVKQLQPIIIDVLEMELDRISRENIKKQFWKGMEGPHRCQKLRIKQLLQTVITSLCGIGHDHLFRAQLDEDANVCAFWDRYGIKRIQPSYIKPEPQNNSRFQCTSTPDFQLRVEKPLPEFISRDDPVCSSSPVEPCTYFPTVLGQNYVSMKHNVTGGHLLGDPCEFNMLTVLNSRDPRLQEAHRLFGKEHAEAIMTGYGITSSFISTVAQAYSQGFNTFNDLTYPITTQTILTDGQKFTLMVYQLNTLHMWKNDEANPLKNLCWLLPEAKLYDKIEDGKLMGFNGALFELLVKFFMIKPMDRPDVDLRPYLSKDSPSPLDTTVYIEDTKEEEVVEPEFVFDQSK